MITAKQFDAFIPILRKLGNNRSAYNIFVDVDDTKQINAKEAGLALPVQKQILILKDTGLTKEQFFADNCEVIELDQLADKTFSWTGPINVVFGKASVLFTDDRITEFAPMFNEVHTKMSLHTNLFRLVHTYDMTNAYVRALLNDTDIVAFKVSKANRPVMQSESFVKWEDWHTILISKSTKQAVQIIWDTREILGYAVLTDAQFKTVVSDVHADDNSIPLFVRTKMPAETKFSKFIIDTIDTENL
jgi:hypothetical protein